MQTTKMDINAKKEETKIVSFIKKTLKKNNFNNVVIACSGGIDSTVSLFLLAKAVNPKNIFPVHLPYDRSHLNKLIPLFNQLKIPKKNIQLINIKPIVSKILEVEKKSLKMKTFDSGSDIEKAKIAQARNNNKDAVNNNIRLGNLMARTRMIIIYDLAKKYDALVCGTENKSEHLLGYFTRFGDSASDLEPIIHLNKTQIYQVAKYLKIPAEIISQKPTAGLWENQTDEGELGFTYLEADQVLHLYFDQKKSLAEIERLGFKNAKKILVFSNNNNFKNKTPYHL